MLKRSVKSISFVLLALLLFMFTSGCGSADTGDSSSDVSDASDVYDVSMVPKTDDNKEHAVIIGTDKNGDPVWTVKTNEYDRTELSAFTDIGIRNDSYYYVERGSVVCLDVNTGSEKWRNDEFGGAPPKTCAMITDEGSVYLSGYYGPDFFAIDSKGSTLARIDKVDEAYFWPTSMQLSDDKLTIYMENSPAGSDGAIYIDLNSYSGYTSASSGSGNDYGNNESAQYSNDELVQLAIRYYAAQHGETPPYGDVVSEDDNEVTIHLYEDTGDHIATWDWYTVDRNTLIGHDFSGSTIDLNSVR